MPVPKSRAVAAGQSPAKRFKAVGAYIFAGGFTVGVRRAGFDVLAHLEDGDFGVASSRLNHPGVRVYQDPGAWPLASLARESPDLVYCNPPCSVFSLAGYSPRYGSGSAQSDKWRSDPLTDCFRRSCGLAESLSPRVLAVESVQQAFTRGHDLVWGAARRFVELGYSVDFVLLDAARVGLPQRRRRAFLVATRVAIDWRYDRNSPSVTVRDAIDGLVDSDPELPGMSKFYRDSLEMTLPGEELRAGFERLTAGREVVRNARGQVAGRPAFVYRRMAWDDVAPTLLGGPRYFHPDEDRHLSVREFQVLCGYPPDYELSGNIDSKYAQVAKAVTPTVGYWLASNVRDALSAERAATSGFRVVDLERGRVEPVADGSAIRPSSLTNRATSSPRRDDETENVADDVGEAADETSVDEATAGTVDAGPTDEAPSVGKAFDQPIRGAKNKRDRDAREFDQTYLSDGQHGKWVHRDYAAHFFRWGFAAERFVRMRASSSGIGPTRNEGRVLDVGCGPELNFMKTIIGTPNVTIRPEVYVGVDVSPLRASRAAGIKLIGEFDFTRRWRELAGYGPFDVTVCYEVVEHMDTAAASRLLVGVRELMADDGVFLLSTPVFDGHRARNHVHEFTVDELRGMVEDAGLVVERRFGTFASLPAIRRACTPSERKVLDDLSAYYRNDVLSCILAPLYPDASRNNLWALRRGNPRPAPARPIPPRPKIAAPATRNGAKHAGSK